MKIRLVTPAPRGSRAGNRITARRWASLLRGLGHTVVVEREYLGGGADVLVALHARKSHASVARFRRAHPGTPVVVALTGTDLYVDLARSRAARTSVAWADALVVLQPLALDKLPRAARRKTHVIHQSATAPVPAAPLRGAFEVCVLGHLRTVKDPLRAAYAARRLPRGSRVRVTHIGRALSDAMARRARAEMARNARYVWLGERPRAEALRLLGRARAMVLSSASEGGANAISEAVVAGVPVLASRIPGSVGLLGARYPGYYPLKDTRALTALLARAEREPAFLDRLRAACARLAPRFHPDRERDAWARLLATLAR